MKKIQLFLYVIFLLIYVPAFSQVGIGTASPDVSSKLDVSSTTQGLLAPRMLSTQRTAITSPATGLIVYQTDGAAGFYYNAGTTGVPNWVILLNGSSSVVASNITGILPVANGGTAATTASAALTNLGAAPLASPTFTGTPAAPTAATGTNTTQLATTAFVNTAAGVHAIGDNYMGGIVFFVYDNGTHGLIAATADQSISIKWYPGTNGVATFTTTMAMSLSVGGGSKNTAIIIANQGLGDGTGYAARICNEYYVTIGGVNYGDWYLPSHAELTLLYYQRTVVGGFSTGFYWSSSESNTSSAYSLNFNDGIWNGYNWKGDYKYVRAIRAF